MKQNLAAESIAGVAALETFQHLLLGLIDGGEAAHPVTSYSNQAGAAGANATADRIDQAQFAQTLHQGDAGIHRGIVWAAFTVSDLYPDH